MKTLKNFNLIGLILLTSGLMSCNENNPPPPDPIKVADGFALKTLKGEVQSQVGPLSATQSLMTQISLTSQGQVVEESTEVNVTIKSFCNSEDQQVSKSLNTSLRSSYPFFELVPESLLLESVVNKTVWLCNFEFEAIDRNLNKHIFDIKNIPLQNTGDGFVSTLLKDSLPESAVANAPLIVRESELNRYTVVADSGEADHMTLNCDQVTWPLLGKNTNFQVLSHLQKDSQSLQMLLEIPQQLCRVHIYRQDQLVGLSPLLNVIFDPGLKDAQVSVTSSSTTHYNWYYDQRPHSPLHLWTVSLKNTSTYPRYFHFDFSNLQSLPVTLIGMHYNKSPRVQQKAEAQLQLPDGARLVSEAPQSWTVALPAGRTAQVHVFVRLSHQCAHHPTSFIDLAALIQTDNFPQISQVVLSETNQPSHINFYQTHFGEMLLRNSIPPQWDQTLVDKHYRELDQLSLLDGCTYTQI